jgi:hypothetical protein
VLIGKAQEKTTTFRTTKGHASVMIAFWVKMPFSKPTSLKPFPVNEWQLYASPTLA